MSKHTPGPWQYAFEGGTVAFITEADGTTVAKLSTTENTTAHKNLAANARLIAAAPDLLEFAEEVRRTGDTRLASMAIAAIAKATGESR